MVRAHHGNGEGGREQDDKAHGGHFHESDVVNDAAEENLGAQVGHVHTTHRHEEDHEQDRDAYRRVRGPCVCGVPAALEVELADAGQLDTRYFAPGWRGRGAAAGRWRGEMLGGEGVCEVRGGVWVDG